MTILGYIVLASGLAFLHLWMFKDRSKSVFQPLHLPPGEKTAIYRDSLGYYSQTKGIIVDSALTIAVILAAIFTPWEYSPLLLGGVCFVWGLVIMDGIRKDVERLEANKAKQLATLALLKSDPEGDHLGDARLRGFGKKTVWVFGTFYDFHTDVVDASVLNGTSPTYFTERTRAEAIMRPRLINLAKKPESEWFLEDRAK